MQTDAAPLAKTSVAYWMQRVKIPEGRAHYGVQIAHRGRRQYFSLETAEKSAAASKARQLYLDAVGQGWESTMAKHRPKAVKKTKTATVGAIVTGVSKRSRALANRCIPLAAEARLSPGEWACATGHAEMLLRFLATDAPWGLFLEDDVSFLASASRFRECGAVLEKKRPVGAG